MMDKVWTYISAAADATIKALNANDGSNLLVALLSGLIASIIGALIGALIPFVWGIWREKRTTTLALIKEFDSIEMYIARTKALAVVRRYPTAAYDAPVIHGNPDADSLWALLNFYRALYLMVKNNRVEKQLVIDGFGQTFVWWYALSFRSKLKGTEVWEVRDAIVLLYEWFVRRTDPDRFQKWLDSAENDSKRIFGVSTATAETTTLEPGRGDSQRRDQGA